MADPTREPSLLRFVSMTDQLRSIEEKLAIDPSNGELVDQLRAYLWDEGDWRGVYRLCENLHESPSAELDYEGFAKELSSFGEKLEPGPEKGKLFLLLGDFYHRRLVKHEEGMAAYEESYSAHPYDRTPLQRAAEVYLRLRDWEKLLKILQVEKEVATEATEKGRLLLKIAQVFGDGLESFSEAIAALDELANLNANEPFGDQLRVFYSAGHSVEDEILFALERAEEGINADDDGLAAAALIEAAQLEYDRLGGSLQEALELANQALSRDPENEDAQLIVAVLSEESAQAALDSAGPQRSASHVNDEETSEEDSCTESYELRDSVGEEELENEEIGEEEQEPRSVEAFYASIPDFRGSLEEARNLLEKDRSNLEALKVLRGELLGQGDNLGLVELLEGSVRYLRKQRGEWELMTELANLFWLELGDDDRAEYYFKRLKSLDENHGDVFRFYEAYYESTGDWRKLYALLAARLEQVREIEDHRELTERLAELAAGQLESPEKAIGAWKNFARAYPEDREVRIVLRQLYEDHEKWNALVELLKEEIRELSDGDEDRGYEVVTLLEETAHIYRNHLNLDTMVMNIMAQILELDPGHPSAFAELRDLFEKNRRYNDLAGLLAEEAERVFANGDAGMAVGHFLEVADIWEGKLNNQTQALPFLERILEIAPEEIGVRDRLREIYETRRDYRSLFDLRLGEVALLGEFEREEELQALRILARDRLRDPEREVKVLRLLLSSGNQSVELLDELIDAEERLENWQAVIVTLEQKSSLVEDKALKIKALTTAAQRASENLDDKDEAARIWAAVLELDREHEPGFSTYSKILEERREYDELESLYLRINRAEELHALFKRLAEEGQDPVELLRRRASIAERELEDIPAVISALEDLCLLLEDQEEILRELLPWYQKVGALEEEIETRRTLLETMEVAEKGTEFLILATLEEERSQEDVALGWVMKALELHPGEREIFLRAQGLAETCGMVETLIDQALLKVQDQDLSDEVRLLLLHETARIRWKSLEDLDGAVELYERIREEDPEEFEVLQFLDELYLQKEDHRERVRILQAQLDLLSLQGSSDSELIEPLSKIADVQRSHLGEKEAALETYSQILDHQPDHLGAIRGIKELYREEERWTDVMDYLLREVPLAIYESPEAQWAAKMELAEVFHFQLDDLHEALRYYGQILGENPEYEAAQKAVRTLLAEDSIAREASLMVEPLLRDLQQHAPLAEALEARLRVCTDPFEEQEILDELIPIYSDELGDTAQAFEHARRQFEIDPERDDIWLRFEQLGARLNKWELIEEMFSKESPLAGFESPTRFDLLRHLAAIREHRLQKTEEALTAWLRLHEYDPLDLPTLEALERLYRKMGNIEGLVQALRSRAPLVELDEDRVRLYMEAGELLASSLGEDVEATEVFEEVLRLDPEQSDAVDNLEHLYRRQERWHDLDALLGQQAETTLEPDLRRQFLKKLAILRYEKLADTPAALGILCDLLEEDPGDDQVLEFSREIDRALEEEQNLGLRLDLAKTLEPIYRLRGEYHLLDGTLGVRLEASESDYEKIELLDEIVGLRQKKLSDPSRAFDAQAQSVLIQPGAEDRRKKLLELANGTGRVEDAITVLEEAALEAQAYEALEIWKSLGRLATQKLDDAARGIEYFEKARDLDEGDVSLLEKLERLYEKTGESARLCENLEAQANYAAPDQRISLLRRIAVLREQVLHEPLDAIDTYRRILEVDPDDLKAIEALERLYRQESQFFELIELWGQKVQIVESGERQGIYLQWAQVAENELSDIPQAITTYRQILEENLIHEKALEELDRLLEGEAHWAEWVEIARRRLATPAAHEEALELDLQLRLGRVLVKELFEVQEGIRVYREILGARPGQPDAVAALEEVGHDESWIDVVSTDLEAVYRQSERWEDLLELFERRRDLAMDPHQKAQFYFRGGEIHREQLNQPEEAMRAYAQAWMLLVERRQYKEALFTLGAQEERWGLLVELIGEVLSVVVNPDLTCELHHRLAQIWQVALDDPGEAEGHLRAVLNLEPLDDDAFSTLSEMLKTQERWHDLIDLLQSRHDAVLGSSEKEAVEILLQIADLQAEKLDDGFSAVESLGRLRALRPRHQGANQRLENLLRSQERWEDLALFFEEKISLAQVPSDVLKAEMALAELCRGPLSQVERAIDLYGRALSIDAGHKEAIRSLEEIFAEDGEAIHSAQAARLLEPVYRTTRNRAGLAEVLEARALASTDQGQREQWLRELADLAEELQKPRWAWRTLARLFMVIPGDESIKERFWRLSSCAHGWGQLIEVFDATLAENFEIDDELRSELHLDRARLFADRLDDLKEGREAAEMALKMNPESEDAIDFIERILQRQGAWQDLADFYRLRGEYAADEERKLDWYERLAILYEDVLEDVDATVDVYARLLELAPGEEVYRKAMERILGSVGRWYDLADIYRQRIAGAFDPELLRENRFSLAQLLESELNSPEEAVHLYSEILTDDPGNSEALRSLEGLRRDLARKEGSWDDLRRMVIETLLNNYEESRAWQRIDDLLDEQVELTLDRAERVQVLVEKAELLLRVSTDVADRVHALTTLAQAYCLEPLNEEIDAKIKELASALDAWERVVPIYLRALGKTDNVDRQGHILTAIARVYENQIGDKESAIAAYQQSVEISIESNFALEKLQELYGEMEKWEPLVQILERRMEVVYDDQLQTLRKRVARIYDEVLNRPEKAIPLYEEVRRDEPDELSYLVILQRLYESTAKYEALEGLLLDKLQLVEADSLRAPVLKRLGEIRRDYLDRIEDGIACFHDALACNDQDLEVMEYLIDLYRELERWPDLVDMLRVRSEAGEGEAVVHYEVEMGRVLALHLHDSEGALESFKRALIGSPHNESPREALFELIGIDQVRHQVVELLTDLYVGTEEWERLEAVYREAIAQSQMDRHYCAQQLVALAGLYLEGFLDQRRAFDTLGQAVALVPEDEEIRAHYESLAVPAGGAKDLVQRYRSILDGDLHDAHVRRALHLVVGAGFVEVYEDLSAAIPHFEALLEFDELDREALEWLERIYGEEQRYKELAGVYETQLRILDGVEAQGTRFRLAYLVELDQEDYPRAFDLYRQVLHDEPAHIGTIEALERLCAHDDLRTPTFELLEPHYVETNQWAKLIRLYELRLETLDDRFERSALYREMGRIEAEEVGDSARAFEFWQHSLREDPHEGEIQERLEMLAIQKGRLDELVALYEEIVAALDDPARSLELAEKGARWALDDLKDPTRTAALYRAVLQIDPEHPAALETLERLAREEGDLPSLEAVLTARVSSTFDQDALAGLYKELATVRIQIQSYEDAIIALEELQVLKGEDQEGLETLSELYGLVEQWEKKFHTLEKQLSYHDEEEQRFLLLSQMGMVALEKLEDYRAAKRVLSEARSIESRDLAILRGLEEVFSALDEKEALLEILGEELTLQDEKEERVRLFIRRARLHYEAAGDVDGAIKDYQAAIALQDDHPDVIKALGGLYRSEGHWDRLVDLLTAQARRAEDTLLASNYFLEVAVVLEEELKAVDRAAEFALASWEAHRANVAALDKLEALQRSRKDWAAVVELIDYRIGKSEGEERKALLLERARTLEEDARDFQGAADTVLLLLGEEPQEESYLRRLEKLLESARDGQGLYNLYRQQAETTESDADKIRFYLKMGETARRLLDNPEARVQALEKAVALGGEGELSIVEPLLDAYIEGDHFDQAEPLLDRVIDVLQESRRLKDAVRFYHLRGKLAEQQGLLDQARKAYDEAHRIDATYVPNLLSLGKLSIRQDDWEGAKKTFQILLLHQMNIKSNEDKVDVYFHLGKIRERDGDERGARDMYKRALRVDPNHEETKASIEELG